MPPHILLGTVGAILFATTTTYLLVDWDALNGLRRYEVTVSSETQYVGFRTGTMGPHDVRDVRIEVPFANVTTMRVRVTWVENVNPLDPHRVAVSAQLRMPDGSVVALMPSAEGGTKGIDIRAVVRPTPDSAVFSASSSDAAQRFVEQWPAYDKDAGPWVLTLTSSGDAGASGISFHAEFELDSYSARMDEIGTAARPR